MSVSAFIGKTKTHLDDHGAVKNQVFQLSNPRDVSYRKERGWLFFLQESIDPMTRALVLAIGVCYHAKLQEKRQDYRKVVAQSFKDPCVLPGGEKQILREITRCLFL